MTRIVITGATGFVGSCLMRRLVEMGADVHIFTRRESNKWRIDDLLRWVTNHEVDLRDAAKVETLVAQIRPAIIYHLATYGGFAFEKDTSATIETNFTGTVNLLRACTKIGFDCFVNTGSSSEYGMKSEPMKETDILEPVGGYGVSKAAATLFCRSEAIQKGLSIVTLRLFSPYGPWDDAKRLIPYVVTSLLRGKSPCLSTPKYVRDYVFIEDVVNAYLHVIQESPLTGDIINIGSGTQHSIGEVVSVITNLVGSEIEPIWGGVESERPEPAVWVSDINKAKSKLNWQSSTSIRAGLEKTVEWFQKNIELYP